MDQRAKGNSYVSAAMSLGIVVGPGIGGFLAEFGLKFPFLISAIVSLVSVIFSIVLLKESDATLNQGSQTQHQDEETMVQKIARSVKMPYFIPLVITLVMSFGLIAYEAVIGLYLDNQFGSTAKDIAIMVTGTGIVSVIVQLFVVDRIVNRYGEKTVLNFFIAVAAVGFFLSMFATSYAVFFGISLIIFLSSSILRPVLNTLISKLAGNEQGFAMGMNNAYMSIGNVAGPTFAGLLYDVNLIYPFVLGLVLLMVTLLITITWQKRSLKVKSVIEN
jgi:MFS transporter, DHA1 family, multidrug resistance protein